MADIRNGVCLVCGGGVLNSGEHIDPERHTAAVERILAAFGATPRGVHNHDIDPACPETRLPDGSLRGECATSVTPPTVKPSVEDVARAILMATQAADVDPDYAWNVQYPEVQDELLDQARAVLALLPGRTEAEVYREGYDQGLRDAASVSRSEAEVKAEALREAAPGCNCEDDYVWLNDRAARIERGDGRG